MYKFCKKIACTEILTLPDQKYCNIHVPKVCNFPNCNKISDDSGLCHKHMAYAEKYIKNGKTTIDSLIAKGLINKGFTL